MRTVRVAVFSGPGSRSVAARHGANDTLEDMINRWIESHSEAEIVDIKFAGNETGWYGALIHYTAEDPANMEEIEVKFVRPHG